MLYAHWRISAHPGRGRPGILLLIMFDCNGKMELVTRTRRRAALTSRTTTTNHIQQLCPMNEIAGSEALPRSRRGHQTNRSTAFSTVSHGPSRYPIVRTSWYRLRSPYASLPANLGNLEQIGAKFLGPNRFGVFFLNMAERLPTCSRFRAYWKIGSEFGLV